VIKTRAGRSAALAARVRELHPATLPEVLELPASGGSDAYLAWIGTETTS
jgi:periplasmic divalent cation tolerance protein